jgi:transcriptional regulator with XRE-family HTH domain
MIDLKRLAFDNGMGQKELGEILNVAQSQVSLMQNGRRDILPSHIELLNERFGEEVVKSYMVDDEIANIFHTPQNKQVTAEIIPAQVVEEIKAEVAEEIRAEVVEEVKAEIEEAISVPLVSSKVANNATINIRKFVEKQGDEMERINPSNLVAHADIAERIRKGSMMPTFMPGDIVFVQFLDDKKIIADGHTYYFDLRDRPTIIRKVKFEGDKLRLIADNPNYGDIMTTFDEIDNVADIVGMFRTMFANQYADIEEVRRKKDEQVDSLIKEVSKAGVRVDKMMEQMSLLVKHAIEKK